MAAGPLCRRCAALVAAASTAGCVVLPTGALVEYRGRWRDGDVERALPGGIMFEFRENLISQIQVRVPLEQLS